MTFLMAFLFFSWSFGFRNGFLKRFRAVSISVSQSWPRFQNPRVCLMANQKRFWNIFSKNSSQRTQNTQKHKQRHILTQTHYIMLNVLQQQYIYMDIYASIYIYICQHTYIFQQKQKQKQTKTETKTKCKSTTQTNKQTKSK